MHTILGGPEIGSRLRFLAPENLFRLAAVALLTASVSCSREAERDASCPTEATAPALMPRTTPEHQRVGYWLDRIGQDLDLDEVLLSVEDTARFNAAARAPAAGAPPAHRDLLEPLDAEATRGAVREMLGFVRERVAEARYVNGEGDAFDDETLAALDEALIPATFTPTLHIALATTPLRCAPVPRGFFVPPVDLGHDTNSCSTAHAQEVLQVIGKWPNGMRLARTRYSMGWITPQARLSPEIPSALRSAFVHGEQVRVERDLEIPTIEGERLWLGKHTLLPSVATSPRLVLVASEQGFHAARPPPDLAATRRPLTRRALVETAFSFLDSPYGYGGLNGGRDCSRLMLDIFESFGIELPRYSGWQARAGTFVIEVGAVKDVGDKLQLVEAAARHGIVLLHFQGHIMLYLGRDRAGVPMVLHALGQYRERCGESEFDTLYTLRRVAVSDLELGRGTHNGSYLQRVSELTVFGHPPDAELRAMVSRLVPAARSLAGVAP